MKLNDNRPESLSHSTRVRGLKYILFIEPMDITTVALYTSAWIEMLCQNYQHLQCFRRTLHECVDWNNIHKINIVILIPSHSTRVRGLKFLWLLFLRETRSRTLHECVDWNLVCFLDQFGRTLSHSTRVRGLKSDKLVSSVNRMWSHSTRVRGLKFDKNALISSLGRVALYTSAWIEMMSRPSCSDRIVSRTLHECVDWNDV